MEFANPLPRPLKKKIPFVKFVPTVFKNWTWQEYETNQASLAPSLRLLLRYTKSPRPMKNSQSATEGVIYTITDWLGRRQMIFFFFLTRMSVMHYCQAILSVWTNISSCFENCKLPFCYDVTRYPQIFILYDDVKAVAVRHVVSAAMTHSHLRSFILSLLNFIMSSRSLKKCEISNKAIRP